MSGNKGVFSVEKFLRKV